MGHHRIFYFLDISEAVRVEKSKSFVERVNKISRQIQGGHVFYDLGVALEDAGKHCPMCQLRGCCLGPNCLGKSGMLQK